MGSRVLYNRVPTWRRGYIIKEDTLGEYITIVDSLEEGVHYNKNQLVDLLYYMVSNTTELSNTM